MHELFLSSLSFCFLHTTCGRTHFGIIHDEFYCGFAVFDAKFMAVSFVYVYNRITGELFEHKRTAITRGAIHVPEQLWRGDGFFRLPGYAVHLQNRLTDHRHHIHIDIQGNRTTPPIRAEFTIHEQLDQIQPLITVLPVNDYHRPMYTHKAACPVEGRLQVGSQTWEAINGTALVDVQKTYYPHNAFWQWATFAGQDQQGVPIALNLTHNMITDDDRWNENCAWIDGRLIRFSAARFDFDPANTQQRWHIRTTDDKVQVTFTPQGERSEKIAIAGLMRSDFHQPFGTYHGTIMDDAGQTHTITEAFGVAEHHILQA
ncbi:MAG: DUF2804 domain-containing protein [Anaerolineae bacterium]|nr:DUF2804 domain-containing protein [Anaerolineae bacterium]